MGCESGAIGLPNPVAQLCNVTRVGLAARQGCLFLGIHPFDRPFAEMHAHKNAGQCGNTYPAKQSNPHPERAPIVFDYRSFWHGVNTIR
jgi:hypothetical protein